MLQMNLLKMVQLILSSMDSDEVNDIGDTVEAGQVVDILEQTYIDILPQLDLPQFWNFLELTPSGDASRPTIAYLPDGVERIEWIRYDCSETPETTRDWRTVYPMDRALFFDRMNNLDSSDTNVYSFSLQVGSETFDVRGFNDRAPTYYTVTDNNTLIFDNFDFAEGQTITGGKTQAYGQRIAPFIRENTWVPPFKDRQISLFFNEAKSQCFLELKQVENAKAEQRARRAWNHAARKGKSTDASDVREWTGVDYARRGGGRGGRVRMH